MTNIDYLTTSDAILTNSNHAQNGNATTNLNQQQQQQSISLPETLTIRNHFNNVPQQQQQQQQQHKRKLILHFDQHNTIQVACTLPGRRITVEEGLNHFLTSVVWGKEVADEDGEDRWEWVSGEPRLTKPPNEPHAVTYFKYLEKKIVKSPDDRARLKQMTCRFVHEEPGAAFKEYFDLYLESLIYQSHSGLNDNDTDASEENDENLYYYTNGKFDYTSEQSTDSNRVIVQHQSAAFMNGNKTQLVASKKMLPPNTIPAGDPNDKSLYHLILPEFFDMIRRLQKANREFAIILRTMGIDSHNFLDTIKPVFEGKHRDFRDIKPLKINPSIGEIKRSSDGSIALHIDNEVYTNDAEIYEKLSSLEGISAIRDDFAYWQANEYSCYAAKPLWIDLNDTRHHHIIFDDNIRLDSSIEDCIVNIRLRRCGSPPDMFESIDFDSYTVFEKSSILQPNLIKLLNPHLRADSTRNYYYDLVRKSEVVYDRLLEEREKLDIVSAFPDDTKSPTSATVADEDKTSKDDDQQVEGDDSQDQSKEEAKLRRNSEDVTLLNEFKRAYKNYKNLKLNRSFSTRLEEAEQQAEKENVKSTLCVIN